MSIKELLGFSQSDKIKVGDRVRHVRTRRLGTVIGTSVLNTANGRLPQVSVKLDDYTSVSVVACTEFVKVDRQNLIRL